MLVRYLQQQAVLTDTRKVGITLVGEHSFSQVGEQASLDNLLGINVLYWETFVSYLTYIVPGFQITNIQVSFF